MAKTKPLYLTAEIVDLFDNRFKHEATINLFSNEYVYFSQNFKEDIHSIYQMIGYLGGSSVNSWKEEQPLTTAFIISDADYELLKSNTKSKEVQFIENLLNKKQTLKDEKGVKPTETKEKVLPKLTSNIHIVRLNTLKGYIKNRSSYPIKANKIKNFKENIILLLQQG